MGNNPIASIPPSIGNLTHLKDLNLGRCQITELPYEIENLVHLEKLSFYSNEITEIPLFIGDLINLKQLDFSSNKIVEIPSIIGNLVNLESLYLSKNQIVLIPPEIGNLINLSTLFFYENQIIELPPEIGNLSNLRILHLYDNQITDVTFAISNLPNLWFLSIHKNKITNISFDTLKFGLGLSNAAFMKQTASLETLSINKGSAIEYHNLIPPFVQHLQLLNRDQLQGEWRISMPDGTYIVVPNDPGNPIGNQFTFEQAGEYLVEYFVDESQAYIIDNSKVYDLKYITKVIVAETAEKPFNLDTTFYTSVVSNTEEYKLSLTGFIEIEVIEGSNILTLDQIKNQSIAISVVNQKTGEKRVMDQNTIESLEITVKDGAAIELIINGRVQTSKGKLDRYRAISKLQ